MSFGIHKQGQGYWVRVLTAALIAVATLGAAGWMAGQTARFEAGLERKTFEYSLNSTDGVVAVGDAVTLVGKPEGRGAAPKDVGTAKVASYDSTNRRLLVNDIAITAPDADATVAGSVRGANFTGVVGSARGISPIEPRLLIGIVVGLVLAIGAGIAYYVTGVRRGAVDFLISTDMEMKKVHWSSAKEIRGSTLVVIGACVLIAGFLFGIDLIFQWFFRLINILVDAG
jgi:preprotein translocase SecE subunit